MRYKVLAEHTQGQSTTHRCRHGLYYDPVNEFPALIEASGAGNAKIVAWEILNDLVGEYYECDCERRLRPGSERWRESVCITVEPA